jgi:thioredoxin-related protein
MKLLVLGLLAWAGHAQQWNSDLEQAQREAAREGKKVLLYFSASGHCAPCQDLEEKVFSSDEFKAYAGKHFVLVKPEFDDKATFAEKADNLLIVEKYNKDGFFPWVVILDPSGKAINKVGQYNNESPIAYLKRLESR